MADLKMRMSILTLENNSVKLECIKNNKLKAKEEDICQNLKGRKEELRPLKSVF